MQPGRLCNLPEAESRCEPWSDGLLGHTIPSHHTARHVSPFPESCFQLLSVTVPGASGFTSASWMSKLLYRESGANLQRWWIIFPIARGPCPSLHYGRQDDSSNVFLWNLSVDHSTSLSEEERGVGHLVPGGICAPPPNSTWCGVILPPRGQASCT